ncbi:MAG: OPT/YSL family transporter [Candidatus Bathyarchaeota archaeon]|nr:OPT/YSL family transporter [Candidatus Bathyarchaeota archaeon]
MSSFYGARITKQEAFLIYMLAGIEFLPIDLLYRQWFRNAPIVQRFGIANELPTWWFPPADSPVYILRTFLQQDWLIPIVLMVTWTVVSHVISASLGLFARELYVEEEDLPFPIQQVSALAITSLTSEEKHPSRVLAFFGLFGFAWGMLVYAFPFIIQAYSGRMTWLVPVPWVDMNQAIEKTFPGASFGIATDLIPFTTGLVMPFNAVVSAAIASIAVYFIGSWLTVANQMVPDTDPITPGYQSWWVPGMDISLAVQRSLMFFWFPILVGLAFAAGTGPILHRPRTFANAIRSMMGSSSGHSKRRRTDPVPGRWIILVALLSIVGGITIFAFLVPDYILANPLLIPTMIGLPIFTTLIGGRVRGETGVSVDLHISQFRNMIYLTTNASTPVWFAPNPMTRQGSGWLANFKMSQLVENKVGSVIKSYFILFPFTVVMAIIYLELFWKMGPIPSARYPGAQLTWPIQATNTVMWMRGLQLELYDPMWILYSLIIGTGIYMGIHIPGLPLSYAGIALGINVLPPFAIAYLIGGIISKALERKLGKEQWGFYARLAAGGLTMGESIAITISVAISLIINSMWILPI